MRLTLIPGTKLYTSRLSFGTASLHHIFSSRDRQNILSTALDVGLTHFDTSPYYGYGLAEKDLGTFLKGRRAAVTLATKVGLYPCAWADRHASQVWIRKALGKVAPPFSKPKSDWKLERVKHEFRASLRRLNTDYIDVLFLHEPNFELLQADELHHWLEEERLLGTIRYWGLAGEAQRLSFWVRENHPLAKVIQTRDCTTLRQADFMLDCHRPLQFTYGYHSTQGYSASTGKYLAVLRAALQRNQSGSIIVSSRRTNRVAEFANLLA